MSPALLANGAPPKIFVEENEETDTVRVAYGAAMRGRYNEDGKIVQNLELNGEEISNAITTVQKDSLVVIKERILSS